MSRISRIEAVLVSVPLKRDYRGSTYSVPQKNAIVTRIHTDDGLVGECGRRREPAGFGEEVVDLAAHAARSFAVGQLAAPGGVRSI